MGSGWRDPSPFSCEGTERTLYAFIQSTCDVLGGSEDLDEMLWWKWWWRTASVLAGLGCEGSCKGYEDSRNVAEEDDACLMQFANSHPATRAVRPSRPGPWEEMLRQLRSEPRSVRRAVLGHLETWLEQQVLRLAHPAVEVSMMLRDSRTGGCEVEQSPDERVRARELSISFQHRLRTHLEESLRHRTGARLQEMLDHVMDLAEHYDNLNVDGMLAGDLERDRQDFEEVQLQYLTNQQVRTGLQSRAHLRRTRLKLLIRAMRNQLGAEARHLRRMCIALQGLLLIGETGTAEAAEGPDYEDENDRWVAEMVDSLVLLAAQDHGSSSTEVAWHTEIMRLRRWLGLDRFMEESDDEVPEDQANATDHQGKKAVEVPDDTQESGQPSKEGEDVSSLVQGKRLWKRTGSRSRSRERDTGRRDEHRQARDNATSNAHRPWRNPRVMRDTVTTTTSSQWRTKSSSSRPPPTSAPSDRWGTAHPTVVQTDEGSCNLGVAAWRALLDMTSPMDPITEPESGLTSSQRENIMATFQNMPPLQIAHLLGSFLRTIAVVCHEVADCLEESIDAGAEQDDETSLMHRYLKKSEDKNPDEATLGPGATEKGTDVPLFGSAVELQLSTIVSALEIMSRHTAARRARAIRQHLHLLYLGREGSHRGLPEEAGWVDSAMVTFLEDGGDTSEADFGEEPEEPLVGQDKEFVDYWWRVLHRHLPLRDDGTSASGTHCGGSIQGMGDGSCRRGYGKTAEKGSV